MRTRWKVFWGVCACLIGIGIIFCIVGAGMGATMSGIRTLYGADSIYYKLNTYDWDEDHYYDSDNYVQGDEEDISSFTDMSGLHVEVSYLEVAVREYDGDFITVDTSQISSELRRNLIYETDEDGLTIKTKSNSMWKRVGKNDSGYLVIQIPRGISLKEASFQIDAGRLEIEYIKTEDLDINVGAGQAVVRQFETRELDVECGAGEAALTGTVLEDASVDCGVGDVEMVLNASQNDYDYELKCGIGELVVGDDSYAGLGSTRSIDNGTGKEMDINCGIGRVEVSFTKDM